MAAFGDENRLGGGSGNLLPVAEGQEGILKTAHDLLLLRNPGNRFQGAPATQFPNAVILC
jgi:hypothetical protein